MDKHGYGTGRLVFNNQQLKFSVLGPKSWKDSPTDHTGELEGRLWIISQTVNEE